jgi:hypothetical protein
MQTKETTCLRRLMRKNAAATAATVEEEAALEAATAEAEAATAEAEAATAEAEAATAEAEAIVDTVPETDPQNLSIYSYFPTSVFLKSYSYFCRKIQ